MKSLNNNNSGKNLLPQTNPFAGTILESSYTPKFFYDIKDPTLKATSIITTALGNVIYPQIVQPYHANHSIWAIVFDSIKVGWKSLKTIISDITKQNDLEWRRMEFNEFIAKSKKKYEYYVDQHECIIDDIQKDIDIVNRKKTLMKDYLLEELFVKLQESGVDCAKEDLVIDHIDLRKFPINEKYDTIKTMQLDFNEDANVINHDIDVLLQLIVPGRIISNRIKNMKRINNINENIKKASLIQKKNIAEMFSDLELINEMESALDNIANIYKDTMEILQPIMKELLNELTSRYENDIYKLPPDKMETLRRIKDIFKVFSEMTIVPQKTASDIKKELSERNVDLSKKHYDLKFEILKLSQEDSPKAA